MRFRSFPLLIGLTGCVVAVDDSFCVSEPVEFIEVDIENGDVTIEPDDRLCVEVGLGGVGSNGIGHQVDDRTLYLDYQCGGLCGGDVTVRAPAEIGVRVKLGAGDVSIDGRRGDVFAHLGAGSIRATDLEAEWVELLTGAGEVDAELLLRPIHVDAVVATGSVALELPSGAYAFELDADGGSISLDGVTDDSAADASVHAEVSAGSIEIRGS